MTTTDRIKVWALDPAGGQPGQAPVINAEGTRFVFGDAGASGAIGVYRGDWGNPEAVLATYDFAAVAANTIPPAPFTTNQGGGWVKVNNYATPGPPDITPTPPLHLVELRDNGTVLTFPVGTTHPTADLIRFWMANNSDSSCGTNPGTKAFLNGVQQGTTLSNQSGWHQREIALAPGADDVVEWQHSRCYNNYAIAGYVALIEVLNTRANTVYKANDLVTHAGAMWACAVEGTVEEPGAGTDWEKVATTTAVYSDLADVDLAGLSDGDAPLWDAASGTWKPGMVSGGGGVTVAAYDFANATPTGNVQILDDAADGLNEKLITGMTATGLSPGQPTTVAIDLWISQNRPNYYKYARARLRDGGLTGPVLASHDYPAPPADTTSGHQAEWSYSGTVTPTADSIVVTIEAVAGANGENAHDVWSDTRTFTVHQDAYSRPLEYGDLADVDLTGLVDGDVPVWDAATGTWKPAAAPSGGGGGGVGSVSVDTDSFTRADSTTSLGSTDQSNVWMALAGTWGISGNKAYVASGSGSMLAAVDVGVSDVEVSARLSAATTDDGLLARVTDANNFYALDFTGGVRLLKRVAGTYTTLAQAGAAPAGTNLTTGAEVSLRCEGDQITGYVNGIPVVSAIDAAVPLGTAVGFWQGTYKTATRWDGFEAKQVSPATPSSGGGSGYPPGSYDEPPATANAKDDEFDGTSTVTWTATPTAPAFTDVDTTRPHHLRIKTSGSGANYVGRYQPVPAAYPYTVTTKLSVSWARANYHRGGGIILVPAAPTATSNIYYGGLVYNAGLIVQRVIAQFSGTFGSQSAGVNLGGRPWYLRLVVASATSVTLQLSLDGWEWFTVESAFNPGFTPAFMGLALNEESGGSPNAAMFDFFRVT